ncbi:unnamed protein product [Phytophthora lilii]|uniref:Unnamed protein product n=1 Tax=Phytophthora lilii TaxID=2077276 RepID=A0A9W6WQD0_9STRA|nr:unnamed protein product [Phytophthora lilii]
MCPSGMIINNQVDDSFVIFVNYTIGSAHRLHSHFSPAKTKHSDEVTAAPNTSMFEDSMRYGTQGFGVNVQQPAVSPLHADCTFDEHQLLLSPKSKAQRPILQGHLSSRHFIEIVMRKRSVSSTLVEHGGVYYPIKRHRVTTARRREQCRTNQARYRDRQRKMAHNLVADVQQLREEVRDLTDYRDTLSFGVQGERSVWSTVVEYFRLFRYGFLSSLSETESASLLDSSVLPGSSQKEQKNFLRAAMSADVIFGEVCGVNSLIEQWQRYSTYFSSLCFQLKRMEEQPFGSIVASGTLSFTITLATLKCVFPHLLSTTDDSSAANASICSRLLGQRLHCRFSVRFLWDDSTGRVTQLESTLDLLTPLLQKLGKLQHVSYVLEKALISPSYLVGEL